MKSTYYDASHFALFTSKVNTVGTFDILLGFINSK